MQGCQPTVLLQAIWPSPAAWLREIGGGEEGEDCRWKRALDCSGPLLVSLLVRWNSVPSAGVQGCCRSQTGIELWRGTCTSCRQGDIQSVYQMTMASVAETSWTSSVQLLHHPARKPVHVPSLGMNTWQWVSRTSCVELHTEPSLYSKVTIPLFTQVFHFSICAFAGCHSMHVTLMPRRYPFTCRYMLLHNGCDMRQGKGWTVLQGLDVMLFTMVVYFIWWFIRCCVYLMQYCAIECYPSFLYTRLTVSTPTWCVVVWCESPFCAFSGQHGPLRPSWYLGDMCCGLLISERRRRSVSGCLWGASHTTFNTHWNLNLQTVL